VYQWVPGKGEGFPEDFVPFLVSDSAGVVMGVGGQWFADGGAGCGVVGGGSGRSVLHARVIVRCPVAGQLATMNFPQWDAADTLTLLLWCRRLQEYDAPVNAKY
jgi:hypothetical protein